LYLNNLSTQWKLRKAGQPHTLTFALIGQWRSYRRELATCSSMIGMWSYLGNKPFKTPMKTESHSFAIQTVNQIILNLEAEYGWPAPLQPLVTEDDMEQLRRAINELEDCREDLVKY